MLSCNKNAKLLGYIKTEACFCCFYEVLTKCIDTLSVCLVDFCSILNARPKTRSLALVN